MKKIIFTLLILFTWIVSNGQVRISGTEGMIPTDTSSTQPSTTTKYIVGGFKISADTSNIKDHLKSRSLVLQMSDTTLYAFYNGVWLPYTGNVEGGSGVDQTLSLNNAAKTITISGTGGNSIILSDWDNDASNDIIVSDTSDMLLSYLRISALYDTLPYYALLTQVDSANDILVDSIPGLEGTTIQDYLADLRGDIDAVVTDSAKDGYLNAVTVVGDTILKFDLAAPASDINFNLSNLSSALTPTWDNLVGKPDSFLAKDHTHNLTDLTDFDTSGISNDNYFKWNGTKIVPMDITVDLSNWDQDVGDDFDGDYNSLSNKPNFTTLLSTWDQDVSDDFSGNYNDLSNKPTLFDGTWGSLTNKPRVQEPVKYVLLGGDYTVVEADSNTWFVNNTSNNYILTIDHTATTTWSNPMINVTAPHTGWVEVKLINGGNLRNSENQVISSDTVFLGGFAYKIPSTQDWSMVNGGSRFDGSNVTLDTIFFADGSYFYKNDYDSLLYKDLTDQGSQSYWSLALGWGSSFNNERSAVFGPTAKGIGSNATVIGARAGNLEASVVDFDLTEFNYGILYNATNQPDQANGRNLLAGDKVGAGAKIANSGLLGTWAGAEQHFVGATGELQMDNSFLVGNGAVQPYQYDMNVQRTYALGNKFGETSKGLYEVVGMGGDVYAHAGTVIRSGYFGNAWQVGDGYDTLVDSWNFGHRSIPRDSSFTFGNGTVGIKKTILWPDYLTMRIGEDTVATRDWVRAAGTGGVGTDDQEIEVFSFDEDDYLLSLAIENDGQNNQVADLSVLFQDTTHKVLPANIRYGTWTHTSSNGDNTAYISMNSAGTIIDMAVADNVNNDYSNFSFQQDNIYIEADGGVSNSNKLLRLYSEGIQLSSDRHLDINVDSNITVNSKINYDTEIGATFDSLSIPYVKWILDTIAELDTALGWASGGGGGTTYYAGTGLSLANDTFKIDTTTMATRSWVNANAGGTYTASGGLTLTGSNFTLTEAAFTKIRQGVTTLGGATNAAGATTEFSVFPGDVSITTADVTGPYWQSQFISNKDEFLINYVSQWTGDGGYFTIDSTKMDLSQDGGPIVLDPSTELQIDAEALYNGDYSASLTTDRHIPDIGFVAGMISDSISGLGGGGGTDDQTLQEVTTQGATTTDAITVGGLTLGNNQVLNLGASDIYENAGEDLIITTANVGGANDGKIVMNFKSGSATGYLDVYPETDAAGLLLRNVDNDGYVGLNMKNNDDAVLNWSGATAGRLLVGTVGGATALELDSTGNATFGGNLYADTIFGNNHSQVVIPDLYVVKEGQNPSMVFGDDPTVVGQWAKMEWTSSNERFNFYHSGYASGASPSWRMVSSGRTDWYTDFVHEGTTTFNGVPTFDVVPVFNADIDMNGDDFIFANGTSDIQWGGDNVKIEGTSGGSSSGSITFRAGADNLLTVSGTDSLVDVLTNMDVDGNITFPNSGTHSIRAVNDNVRLDIKDGVGESFTFYAYNGTKALTIDDGPDITINNGTLYLNDGQQEFIQGSSVEDYILLGTNTTARLKIENTKVTAYDDIQVDTNLIVGFDATFGGHIATNGNSADATWDIFGDKLYAVEELEIKEVLNVNATDSTIITQNQLVHTGSTLTIGSEHFGRRIYIGQECTVTFNGTSDEGVETYAQVWIYRTDGAAISIELSGATMEEPDGNAISNKTVNSMIEVTLRGADDYVTHGD